MSRTSFVIADASAVVAALSQGDARGTWAFTTLDGHRLAAPRLMPFEAAGALRWMQIKGALTPAAATAAHEELLGMAIDLWPHVNVAERAWELRDSVTYADACYVALAELLDAPLVTLDARLARASGPQCEFRTPPEEP